MCVGRGSIVGCGDVAKKQKDNHPVVPFVRLLDALRQQDPDTVVLLGMDSRGWWMEIRDADDELLSRVRSTERVPYCFEHLAAATIGALKRAHGID